MKPDKATALVFINLQASNQPSAQVNHAQAAIKLIATVTIPHRPGKSGAPADHSWNYFDGNGWRTYSNENGGVWTRYFSTSTAAKATKSNITQEVRFQRRDAAGQFTDAILDAADRPSLCQFIPLFKHSIQGIICA